MHYNTSYASNADEALPSSLCSPRLTQGARLSQIPFALLLLANSARCQVRDWGLGSADRSLSTLMDAMVMLGRLLPPAETETSLPAGYGSGRAPTVSGTLCAGCSVRQIGLPFT